MLLYFVLPVEFCAAVALMLDWDLIWGVVLDVKWWATTLQFIGALVTALGLLWAYLRATRFRERTWPRIRRWLWRIFGIRGGTVVGPMAATMVTVGFAAEGVVTRRLDRTLSIQEQIVQLEGVVNGILLEELPEIKRRIGKLKTEIDAARSLAESAAETALTKARAEIAKLAMDLDRTQTLDLRSAIVGLFISAIGTFLQYLS